MARATPTKDLIDRETSRRLAVLRFPLIVAIVFIHAYESNVGLSGRVLGVGAGHDAYDFIRTLISQGIARIAVPLFFLTSGYFFFAGFDGSWSAYVLKLRSKVKTLLVPFLLWNILALCFTAFLQAVPQTRDLFSGNKVPVAGYHAYDYLNAVIGIDRMPIDYQFWFIRDLLVLAVFSPALFFLGKFLPALLLASAMIGWTLELFPASVPSIEALLFFSVGMAAALHRKNLFYFDFAGKYIAALYVPVVLLSIAYASTPAGIYWHKAGIILGILCALSFTKFILRSGSCENRLHKLGEAGFFIFAAHEPLLTVARKITYKALVPSTPLCVFALYLLIPASIIFILLAARTQLMRIMPKTLLVLTGGR